MSAGDPKRTDRLNPLEFIVKTRSED
jgi:hypothetical protein